MDQVQRQHQELEQQRAAQRLAAEQTAAAQRQQLQDFYARERAAQTGQ